MRVKQAGSSNRAELHTVVLLGMPCALSTGPALAAAGLVWQTKSLITKEESSLAAQPSILNWHDLPVDLE